MTMSFSSLIVASLLIHLFVENHARDSQGTYASCKAILNANPNAAGGEYTINTNTGDQRVYCEMGINGGGYTFLPRQAIVTGTNLNLDSIFTDKSHVLLRISYDNGRQPFTVLRQLQRYASTPLSVQINSHLGYTNPVNRAMGPKLFLGFLPANIANNPSFKFQGIRSNGRAITFNYCGSNPASYFALFPNHREVPPSSYGGSGIGANFYGAWLNSAKPVPSGRTMANEFFFFTELHFGGCGAYTSSDKWARSTGVAIGFR
ncbi:uncharacterized protein LOC106164020 isoform X4 [Lingula anatina]|uniref:Uncharacterized protein LOC106164020 isoform X4 n=1 Tax=Lingula anatina TaxID=7574 RepID=A0A1S3IH78_LINAN|nr:uncharacterized protein LOC106164020 isoform X4 [Lingula anatina]|eukprot:XP_013397226.1 uncharacterized protein LOC106164020 isoform X4 [Lingula anatina]